MKKFTIRDLATDREYTNTIENLVEFVNNNNDTSAEDYEIDTWCYNQNPTFKLWLSHRGYTFNRCGQIIKEVA